MALAHSARIHVGVGRDVDALRVIVRAQGGGGGGGGGGRTRSFARTRLRGCHMTLFTCYIFLLPYTAYLLYVRRL